MVAKVVVSKMKEQFTKNPKYDYQGLLDKISELEKNIREYVGDTEKVNSKKNNISLQVINASQSAQKVLNPAQTTPNPVGNPSNSALKTSHQQQNKRQPQPQQSQELNNIRQKIEQLRLNYNNPEIKNKENIKRELQKLSANFIKMTGRRTSFNMISSSLNVQNAGQNTQSSIEIKYMEKNENFYFDKAKQFPKYSTTIKQFLFDTLPALESINDRQEKRKEFVRLLHTSLLSTCDIKKEQENKITNFMKNSFPTGLLEQQSQTPTRENKNKGQGMLERVEKLNNKASAIILVKDLTYLIVPFIPLSKDGQNQLDKIIEHMKKMGGFYLKKNNSGINSSIQDKITRANEIYDDLSSRTGIYSLSRGTPLLKLMYPSINDSVGIYIVGMIYKILITYTNYNFYYSQTTKYLSLMLIIIYINYGIQYLLDFLKKAYVIFSVIENFSIINIIYKILRDNKKNSSIQSLNEMFFSNELISTEIEAPYHEKALNQIKSVFTKKKRYYSIEEKILHIKRYYYYVSYFYNEDVKKYYEKYGLIFLYFSLYIPDLIYYISDNKDFNKERINIEPDQLPIIYAKKIQYLFKLSDNEIKNKSIDVIEEFLPKLINYIKTINSSNYDIIGKSNINLNIDKLYKKIMNHLSSSNKEQKEVSNDEYSANNSTNNSNKIQMFQQNFNKLIGLITEPVHFESNEKAIATISGIPAKFEQNLVSPHFFAFDFNLDKIKEVCSHGLMKFSKKDCIEFIKSDAPSIISTINDLFKLETDIWKYFVEIQVSLIKQEFVFASQEIVVVTYISRLFGSSFDCILEIFYQSFPYFMFCFEYVDYIIPIIGISQLSPCVILQHLYYLYGDTIGLEKMIILYKYLNITNIEVMEYIKKYGIIFLIYALYTPFYICQTELNGKIITSHEKIIMDTFKSMDKFELIKRVKSVFDDKKIVEFIKKVEENKNNIFGKLSVAQNNSINLNFNKFSKNGIQYNGINKPSMPMTHSNKRNGLKQKDTDFIWSVFTVPVQ